MNEANSNTTKRVAIWLSIAAIVLTALTGGVLLLALKPAKKLIATLTKPSFTGITTIDLTKFYDSSASWNNPGAWEVVPHGSNVLGGVPFEVNGLLRLTGTASERNNTKPYREKVEDIPVRQKFARLHVLHLAGSAGESGKPYARIVLHYADDSTSSLPIEYGRHARYWHRSKFEYPSALSDPNSKVVWRGTHESTPKTLRLFKTTYENPKPDEVVESIDLVSEHAAANAVILAMSIGPANVPRPADDPPGLPEPEEPYEGQLKFTAVDAESSEPVPNLTLRISGSESSGSFRAPDMVTDKKGECIVPHPGDSTTSLSITAAGDGVAQKTIRWSSREEPIPAEYTFRVTKGVSIGGVVQDEAGQPVMGAKLSFLQYGNVTDPNARERFSIGQTTNTTDAQGRWQYRSLPPDFREFAINVSHPEFAEARFLNDAMERNYVGERVSFAKLLQTNAVMRVRRGLSLAGKVLDKDGKPISGAKVLLGDSRFGSQPNLTRTDDGGAFALSGLAGGEGTLTVQANGYAPDMRRVTVGTNAIPVEVRLGPGYELKVLVIDEFDTPVRSARVTIDQWQNRQTIDLSGTTDSRGRVTIRSAPPDGMSGSIYKAGYMQSYNIALVADGEEKKFILRKSVKITGSVVDAETKQPIEKFEVTRGQSYGGDDVYWQNYNSIKGSFGEFTLTMDQQNITMLKAEADDYLPVVLSLSSNSALHLTFELKKGNGPKGFVQSPNGEPIAGAQLAVTSKGLSLTMGKTKFANNGDRKVALTDASGAFSLRPDPNGENIVVVHTNGYAEVSFSNFVSGSAIKLQRWGVIEGVLKIGDNLGTNQSLLLTPEASGMNRFWYDYQDYAVATDAQGKFVISNVPPGERRVVRLIRIDERSQMHSPLGNVSVKAGEVTHVTFGGDGSLIVGQLVTSDPSRQVDWRNSGHHMLNSYPKPPPMKTAEEVRAWQKLPETVEAQKNARSYVVQLDDSGAFRVEDVLPGKYDLQFHFMERGSSMGYQNSLGSFTTNVVVTARAPDSKTPVIDLGRIEITLRAETRKAAPQAKAPVRAN